jgi:hypothetical protein
MTQEPTTTTIPTLQRQRGHTLVEISISSLLTVFLLSIFQGGVLSVGRTVQANDRAVRELARRNDVLEQVRIDLARSAVDRVSIEDSGATLRFPMLVGAAIAGAEVNGQWSSDVVVQWDPNTGNLVRRQDGATVLLGMELTDFNAVRDGLDIEIRCASGEADAARVRTVRIRPRN